MATVIQIKRPSSGTSVTAPTQSNITTAEMAYVYGTADQTNGGQRLYIGNAAGNGVKVIGGEYFTEMLNHVHGTLTASSALIADSNKKLINKVIESMDRKIDRRAGEKYLGNLGWSKGLMNCLFRSCDKIPIRFYIVDDSGSMNQSDGQRILGHGKDQKLVKGSRNIISN